MGMVEGTTSVSKLLIKAKHMDDVLKTLRLHLHGNNVKSRPNISYTMPRGEEEMGDIKLDINNPLKSLIGSLKGETVKVFLEEHADVFTGRVLGLGDSVDDPKGFGDGRHTVKKPFLLLLSKNEMIRVDATRIKNILMEDDDSSRIHNVLDTSKIMGRNSDVEINFDNPNWNEIRFSYAHTFPVWKPVFELIVSTEEKKIVLYGIINNDTPYDWENIELHLLSDKPYSVDSGLFKLTRVPKKKSVSRKMSRGIKSRMLEVAAEEFASSPEVGEIGLIEGTFKNFVNRNVSIKSMKSAKIYLQTYPIEDVESVLVYDPKESKISPEMGISFSVDTHLTLRGPLTVYNQSNYVGETFIDKLNKGKYNMVKYAEDSQCTIDMSKTRKIQKLKIIQIKGDLVHFRIQYVAVTEYLIKNHRQVGVSLPPPPLRIVYCKNHHDPDEKKKKIKWSKGVSVIKEEPYEQIVEIPKLVEGETKIKCREYWTVDTTVYMFSNEMDRIFQKYQRFGTNILIYTNLSSIYKQLESLTTEKKKMEDMIKFEKFQVQEQYNDVEQRVSETSKKIKKLEKIFRQENNVFQGVLLKFYK
jgi:hypothetical protein